MAVKPGRQWGGIYCFSGGARRFAVERPVYVPAQNVGKRFEELAWWSLSNIARSSMRRGEVRRAIENVEVA
jgi:hypothetical protein